MNHMKLKKSILKSTKEKVRCMKFLNMKLTMVMIFQVLMKGKNLT